MFKCKRKDSSQKCAWFKKLRRNQTKSTQATEATTSKVEEQAVAKCKINDKDREKLQLMVDYINQDACEKIDEIDAKTDEMFITKKAEYLAEKRAKIYDFYHKQELRYQAHLQRVTANALNKGRLFALRARASYVHEILEEARNSLNEVANPNDPKYAKTMKLLILEGLLMLLQPIVMLRVRDIDRDLVKNMLSDVEQEYANITEGEEVKIQLDESILPLSSRGGVILSDPLQRMWVTNTLSTRLDAVTHKLLPSLRTILWNNKSLKIVNYLAEDETD